MMCSRVSEAQIFLASRDDLFLDKIPHEKKSYKKRKKSASERKVHASFEAVASEINYVWTTENEKRCEQNKQ